MAIKKTSFSLVFFFNFVERLCDGCLLLLLGLLLLAPFVFRLYEFLLALICGNFGLGFFQEFLVNRLVLMKGFLLGHTRGFVGRFLEQKGQPLLKFWVDSILLKSEVLGVSDSTKVAARVKVFQLLLLILDELLEVLGVIPVVLLAQVDSGEARAKAKLKSSSLGARTH
jgi:hypothetical protein